MNPILFVFAFVLFFLLTPKVLVCLPRKGSKFVVAGVHALIFALVFILVGHLIWRSTHSIFEGYNKDEYKKKSKDKKNSKGKKNSTHKPFLQKPVEKIPQKKPDSNQPQDEKPLVMKPYLLDTTKNYR
jgi:predicted PurR-regulated permease PerM